MSFTFFDDKPGLNKKMFVIVLSSVSLSLSVYVMVGLYMNTVCALLFIAKPTFYVIKRSPATAVR